MEIDRWNWEVFGGEWKNVPKKLLSPSHLSRVYCGRVQNVDVPIHLKEADAALFVAKHLVRGGNNGQGKRHLILGDSMTLSCVLGKGRSNHPRLLAIARKWACISMAGDLLLVYRWIPSSYNVAAQDSRRWEDNDLPCETNCSSDLKPMVAEYDGSLSPLIEDASPWTEYCAQQIPQTWKPIRRGRKPQRAPIRRLVRWEQVGGNKGVFASNNTCSKGGDLTPNPSPLQNYSNESCGGKSASSQLPREQCNRARNHGQLSESRHRHRDVCVGDQATIGLGKWCGSRGSVPGVPGPLVHPGLRAGSRDSALGRHTDALLPLQSSWRSRYAKDSEGSERVDKIDAVIESLASSADNGSCSPGDSLASQETRARCSNRAQLCGLSSSRRTGNTATIRPGSMGATGRFSLVIREEESGIQSKTHTFYDSVILDRPDLLWMDRLWQALKTGRPGHALLIPVNQSDLAHDIKIIFEELGCKKLGIVAYSLRHGGPSWDFMKKFRNLDEIQQRGRWRSSSSVLRYQKASKLLGAM